MFTVLFNLGRAGWKRKSPIEKILSAILIATLLGAIGTLGYVAAIHNAQETFTEFYILGTNGKAEDYPRNIRVGEETQIIVGIVNREHTLLSYRIKVNINGVTNKEVGPIVLSSGQKWEEIVSFTADGVGYNKKVEFLLYKNEETEPCLEPLRLWIDVTARS